VNLDSKYKECDEKASKFLKKQTTEDRAERERQQFYILLFELFWLFLIKIQTLQKKVDFICFSELPLRNNWK
jgi:hypothetical protein